MKTQLKEWMTKIWVKREAIPSFDQRGQSIIILTFAFLGLVAMLGLALDLGLVYITRVSLKRAVDAATLASVVELPAEEEAMSRAITFLEENGYPRANIYVAGCIRDIHGRYYPAGAYPGVTGPDGLINFPQGGVPVSSPPSFFWDLLQDDGQALPLDELSKDEEDLYYLYDAPTFDDVNGNGTQEVGEEPIVDPEAPSFFIDTRSFQVRTRADDGSTSTNASDQCGGIPITDDWSIPRGPLSGGGPYGSATKIRVYGKIPVTMNFMQFFGFGSVDVADGAVAQNSSNLDVAVVMDVTGSMEFDTICYGCWQRCDEVPVGDLGTLPCITKNDMYDDYPINGFGYPLDFEGLKATYICGNGGDCGTSPYITPGDPKPQAGTKYIIMEAELYSNAVNSIWDPAYRGAGQGYWAMQRSGTTATSVPSENGQAAFVRHHPYLAAADTGAEFGKNYSATDIQNGEPVPRLEYDFIPTWSAGGDDTHIYLRVKAYTYNNDPVQTPPPRDRIFWAVTPFGSPAPTTVNTNTDATPYYDNDANGNNWDWIKLGTETLSNQKYTLHIYAGSPGYAIDRIIIAGGNSYNTISEITASIDDDNATPGTAQRVAADRCNPIYGLSVIASDCRPDGIVLQSPSINNLNDPLFGDRQPIRGAKEAVKAFVERLDPSLDQAGFVQFSTTAWQESQLECLQASAARKAAHAPVANYPLNAAILGEFDETECYNPDMATAGVPIEYRNVLVSIENTYAQGGTDIASGLRRGLNMLGINTDPADSGPHVNDCDWDYTSGDWTIGGTVHDPVAGNPGRVNATRYVDSHCSRAAAATQVLVLLTDGAPTDSTPGDNTNCNVTPNPLPYTGYPGGDKVNCIMYYTEFAANNGIIVYTIGLGAGADPDLLGAVADQTNGQYYFAPSAAQLNIIFNQILSNIYVRLIQ